MGGKSVNYVRAGDMALGCSEARYVMLKAAQSHLVSRSHALSARGSGDMGSTSSHRLRAAQGAQSRAEPHRAAQNRLQMKQWVSGNREGYTSSFGRVPHQVAHHKTRSTQGILKGI